MIPHHPLPVPRNKPFSVCVCARACSVKRTTEITDAPTTEIFYIFLSYATFSSKRDGA